MQLLETIPKSPKLEFQVAGLEQSKVLVMTQCKFDFISKFEVTLITKSHFYGPSHLDNLSTMRKPSIPQMFYENHISYAPFHDTSACIISFEVRGYF